jgi:FixJ family two-component response regulator
VVFVRIREAFRGFTDARTASEAAHAAGTVRIFRQFICCLSLNGNADSTAQRARVAALRQGLSTRWPHGSIGRMVIALIHWFELLVRDGRAMHEARAHFRALKMDAEAVIHIIDDDESLRDALASLFRSVGLKIHSYGSARDFIDAPRLDAPGCIVLDVRLPGMSGIDFQSRLIDLGILLPVVLMTGHGDIPMSVRAMKAGAIDFLAKPFRDQDMLDAVAAAIERDLARRSADSKAAEIRDRFATLSPREQRVMTLVTAGKLNKQVASDLGLSEITVKIHRGAAMRKMGARTLADLVRMAELLNLRAP